MTLHQSYILFLFVDLKFVLSLFVSQVTQNGQNIRAKGAELNGIMEKLA